MEDEDDDLQYAVTFPSSSSAGAVGPEVATIEQLVITRKGREHLKNVPIDSDHAALVIGWYDDRVAQFVTYINTHYDDLPEPPDYWPEEGEVSTL
jgi:hypothetical protein